MLGSDDSLVTLRSACVRQGRDILLPLTSVEVRSGEVVVVVGQPGAQLSAFALAMAGRLPLSSGTVSWNGGQDPEQLRRHVALVDVQDVTEPERGVPVRTTVAEELALAGRKTSGRKADEWLAAHGWSEWSRRRIEEVPALARVSALTDLAALRPGVTHLVIGLPERHGGHPEEWLGVARRHAEAGLGVVITVSHATASHHQVSVVLGEDPGETEGYETQHPEPGHPEHETSEPEISQPDPSEVVRPEPRRPEPAHRRSEDLDHAAAGADPEDVGLITQDPTQAAAPEEGDVFETPTSSIAAPADPTAADPTPADPTPPDPTPPDPTSAETTSAETASAETAPADPTPADAREPSTIERENDL